MRRASSDGIFRRTASSDSIFRRDALQMETSTGFGQRVCFTTKNGTLLELSELEPPRWVDHGQPRDANVAAIADVACFRTEIISMGDFYEYDTNSKPLWKKHVWKDRAAQDL
ncbi:uncharacterized protein E6C27_scaffold190G001770 [Cucumis melo var. makuwa]|uniref:Uncharacterized protein n=1 Tax=Cucumis melo var. makuwa TaxID=1194695 RepID=A0A5A7UCU8_CUCMM|nr:uncharacterized protein E6C27_scaffold190G001770 [Cucumis melo var. makuwa]